MAPNSVQYCSQRIVPSLEGQLKLADTKELVVAQLEFLRELCGSSLRPLRLKALAFTPSNLKPLNLSEDQKIGAINPRLREWRSVFAWLMTQKYTDFLLNPMELLGVSVHFFRAMLDSLAYVDLRSCTRRMAVQCYVGFACPFAAKARA
jgi:hypothetical protein